MCACVCQRQRASTGSAGVSRTQPANTQRKRGKKPDSKHALALAPGLRHRKTAWRQPVAHQEARGQGEQGPRRRRRAEKKAGTGETRQTHSVAVGRRHMDGVVALVAPEVWRRRPLCVRHCGLRSERQSAEGERGEREREEGRKRERERGEGKTKVPFSPVCPLSLPLSD